MKEITVVTTFNQAGLEKYGQRLISSFEDNVDKKIKLLVYAEKCNPVVRDNTQIKILDPDVELPKLVRFKERWKDDPKANGIPPEEIKRKRPNDHHKKFKWDAVRFSNKVYSVFGAVDHAKDWLVWMDGDTYIHSKWSYEEFLNLLPHKCWITYVGRGKGSQTWPECGFYGLNLNSIVCKEFLKEFEHMYENAPKGIFRLVEWHDSFVFGKVLTKYKRYHPNVLDYTGNINLKTARSGGGGHPLINTELGRWIDHLKGDRKDRLKSNKAGDLIVQRTEGYWK